ncbi:MAG TPA: DUF2065 domain-containing protein [Gallionellaceae bacterium]
MLEYWVAAFGLMLVLEGMMPFAFPAMWRAVLRRLSHLQDGQLRFVGLSMMLTGALIVFWVKQ